LSTQVGSIGGPSSTVERSRPSLRMPRKRSSDLAAR
jgi:hypothetical protein